MTHAHHHEYGPTGAGTVVLDIGGDIGALVVATPPELHGHEIDITSSTPAFPRTHSMVRERRTVSGVSFAAVYPGLPAGQYTIWRDPATPAGPVTIEGGQVTRFTLG